MAGESSLTRRQFLVVGIAGATSFVLEYPLQAWAKPKRPWDLASQTDRNNWIVEVGSREVGKNSGWNCKRWVRKVVLEATSYGLSANQALEIPSTVPNEDGWAWARHPRVYAPPQCRTIGTAKKGHIIQMNWKQNNGSWIVHTAIVGDISSRKITFLDSNWPDKNYPGETNRVQSRELNIKDVEKAVSYKFTIYEIR